MSSAAGALNEIENSLNENREFFIQYDKVLFGDLRRNNSFERLTGMKEHLCNSNKMCYEKDQ